MESEENQLQVFPPFPPPLEIAFRRDFDISTVAPTIRRRRAQLRTSPPRSPCFLHRPESPSDSALFRYPQQTARRPKYEGRVRFYFTPTSASWLNQIEIWFGLLTRKALRGESFSSKDQLRSAIEAFVVKTNEPPTPFHWRQREVKGSQLRHTLVSFCN